MFTVKNYNWMSDTGEIVPSYLHFQTLEKAEEHIEKYGGELIKSN